MNLEIWIDGNMGITHTILFCILKSVVSMATNRLEIVQKT